MAAWLTVRERLDGVAIELDQLTVARESEAAASAIAGLLDLSPIERRRVAQILANERPQRTGETFGETASLDSMGWRADWVRVFREVCGPMMDAYGYAEDAPAIARQNLGNPCLLAANKRPAGSVEIRPGTTVAARSGRRTPPRPRSPPDRRASSETRDPPAPGYPPLP